VCCHSIEFFRTWFLTDCQRIVRIRPQRARCVSKLTTIIITTVLRMNMEGLDKLSHDALFQSQQLIESMDDEFLFKSEVTLTQNILRRNQELIGMIDALNESKDMSKDDLAKKNVYALELHSNMQGMSRLLKEMAAASRQKK
jgi:hypothetical protein